jgi:hypothetical protein
MIRTFFLLVAVMLAFRAGVEAQTAHVSAPVRIQVPRVNVRPIVPANNYVYQYPNGYVPYTPLISVRPAAPAAGQTPNLVHDPDPADHLNGLLLSRVPEVQANHLNFPLRSDVRYSDREVANVQQNLRRLGYYTGMADGILGPNTETAIQRYQVDHHLPVTGLLDSGMLSQLGVITRSR